MLHGGRLAQEGPRALSYRDANLHDAVLRLALDYIYESWRDAALIRRCCEGGCRRIFFPRRKNQLFCDHACANKAASRVYREKHLGERRDRERQRYERKMKARHGPGVKVTRRAKQRETRTGP